MSISKFNKFLFFFVFATIIYSFILQHFFNLLPCRLCLYQRYLWIILLLPLSFSIISFKKYKNLSHIAILLLFLFISLISLYHSAIELGYINNVISCSQPLGLDANSIDELSNIIKATKNNDCAFPKFTILHLTLSNFSFIFSSIFLILSLNLYRKSLFK